MRQTGLTLSFDVFDTTLTRIWFKPVDLFVAVGRELNIEGLYTGTPESWAYMRETVERDLRRALDVDSPDMGEEVGLRTIHNLLATQLGMRHATGDRALAIELECERAAVRPIACMRTAIANAQAAANPVIFLTDTYFEYDVVLDLLHRAGIEPAPGSLYTSLAAGRTKRTGSLYSHVLAERRLTASSLHHTGDNVHSDVMSARKAGLKPALFTVQAPNRYEKCLYAPCSGAPRLLRAAAAGAARAARLGHQEANSRWQVIAEIGADVGGPMLTGFVLWIMTEARRRNLNRLYFVARDGQILQRIAVKLNAWLGWEMELRYLYASRQSLFLPSLTTLDEAAIEWLTENARFKTLGAILSRVEIEPQTEVRLLSAGGFPPESWDETLGAEGKSRLRALLGRRDFGSRVLAKAQCHRATLLDYLGQERLTDGTPFGLVDIGWKGRLQASLAKALGTMPDKIVPPLTGFYYGLSRPLKSGITGELLAFTKGPLPNAALLETFAKADHGSVRRFRRLSNGMVEPELLEAKDREALEWGLAAQQGGITQFVDLMLTVLKPADAMPQVISDYLRERGRAAFDLFAHFPSPSEAIAYGMLRHADDQTHSNPIEMAPEIKRGRLIRFLTKHPSEVVRQTIWPEGSIARSTTTIERRPLQTLWQARSRTLASLHKYFMS